MTSMERQLIVISTANKLVEDFLQFQRGDMSISTLAAQLKIRVDEAIQQTLDKTTDIEVKHL